MLQILSQNMPAQFGIHIHRKIFLRFRDKQADLLRTDLLPISGRIDMIQALNKMLTI